MDQEPTDPSHGDHGTNSSEEMRLIIKMLEENRHLIHQFRSDTERKFEQLDVANKKADIKETKENNIQNLLNKAQLIMTAIKSELPVVEINRVKEHEWVITAVQSQLNEFIAIVNSKGWKIFLLNTIHTEEEPYLINNFTNGLELTTSPRIVRSEHMTETKSINVQLARLKRIIECSKIHGGIKGLFNKNGLPSNNLIYNINGVSDFDGGLIDQYLSGTKPQSQQTSINRNIIEHQNDEKMDDKENHKLAFVELRHNGHHFLALVDTGAQSSIVSTSIRSLLQPQSVTPTHHCFGTVNNSTMKSNETVTIEFSLGKSKFKSNFAVLDMDKYQMIIGQNTIRDYNFIVDNKSESLMCLNNSILLTEEDGEESNNVECDQNDYIFEPIPPAVNIHSLPNGYHEKQKSLANETSILWSDARRNKLKRSNQSINQKNARQHDTNFKKSKVRLTHQKSNRFNTTTLRKCVSKFHSLIFCPAYLKGNVTIHQLLTFMREIVSKEKEHQNHPSADRYAAAIFVIIAAEIAFQNTADLKLLLLDCLLVQPEYDEIILKLTPNDLSEYMDTLIEYKLFPFTYLNFLKKIYQNNSCTTKITQKLVTEHYYRTENLEFFLGQIYLQKPKVMETAHISGEETLIWMMVGAVLAK
ncbi:hypothetical protein SNEBB_005288 [Seison nebaliae]|nr:hypothetical protein SNEBB_005288 [Seison nebaliae]